jgi:hypothetical protein
MIAKSTVVCVLVKDELKEQGKEGDRDALVAEKG